MKKVGYILTLIITITYLLLPTVYGVDTELEKNNTIVENTREVEKQENIDDAVETKKTDNIEELEELEELEKNENIDNIEKVEKNENADNIEKSEKKENTDKIRKLEKTENTNNINEIDNNNNLDEIHTNKTENIKATEQTIEEGTYKINTCVDSNKYIDVSGGSNKNEANIQIWEKSNVEQQKYEITYLNNGYYKITALHSGKVLDVQGAGKSNGTNVWQYEWNGSDAQQWIIQEEGNGHYSIISKCNELYLDVNGANNSNGTNVQVYEGNGSKAQQFKFEKYEPLQGKKTIEEGTYKINTCIDSNKYVDVSGGSNKNEANIQIWEKSNVEQQKYEITYLNNGYYKITALHSGKVLDVQGAGKSNGTNVWQYEWNGSDAQQWIIQEEGNGKYSIISKCNELYLDVNGANNSNGTNIQVYEGNGSKAQQFKFEEEENIEAKKTLEDGIYKINTKINSNKYLDINGGSTQNGANAQIWDNGNVYQQRFQVTYLNNGYYKLEALHSRKVLDVESAGKNNGTNVWQYEYNESDAQQWILKELEDGYYRIISKCNKLSLDVAGGKDQNGTNVQVYEWNGSNAQQFKFEKVETLQGKKTIEDGTYKIKMSSTDNMLVTVETRNKGNGANAFLEKDDEYKSQKYRVTYLNNGFYKIEAAHSGKVLDVEAAGKDRGTNVWQYEYNGSYAQQWVIQEEENGCYSIISRCNELYLDVNGGAATSGTNIQTYDGNGSQAQKFYFEETEVQSVDTGFYEIQMVKDNNKVVEVANSSSSNEANVQIGTKTNRNNQKLYIKYDAKSKNYKITMAHSAKSLDVAGGQAVSGTNVWQYENNDTNAQRWNFKYFEIDATFNIISECGNKDLVLDVNGGDTTSGTNVQIYENNNTTAQRFKIVETELNTSSFLNLDEQKYPGYKESLEKLQAQHPNWKINIKYTGIDWNTAVDSEDQKKGNIPYSKTDRTGNWRHLTDTAEYSSGWYRASREAIAYMMDPRNSLDDGYIFQFQDLTSNSGSYNDILRMISGTFLTRYEQWSTNEIVNAILGAAQINNVSPFHITARILQEQGKNGNSLNGYNYEGTIVYNLFNINDTSGLSDDGTIYGRARGAYRRQWFTPITCIMGSTHFLRSNYFDRGQITLYYQKYNIVSEPLFEHQYMQNIRAANDEGKRVSDSYKASGLIDSEFTFEIPVYENMPISPCSRPTT